MSKKIHRSRPNAKGRNGSEPFIKITRNLYSSIAWADLGNVAVRVYLEIRRRYNGMNNGEISLSCSEAAQVSHSGKGTASKALKELIEHGFIKISKKGLYTYRLATTWTLTNEPIGNNLSTNEWRNWSQNTDNSIQDETVGTHDKTE